MKQGRLRRPIIMETHAPGPRGLQRFLDRQLDEIDPPFPGRIQTLRETVNCSDDLHWRDVGGGMWVDARFTEAVESLSSGPRPAVVPGLHTNISRALRPATQNPGRGFTRKKANGSESIPASRAKPRPWTKWELIGADSHKLRASRVFRVFRVLGILSLGEGRAFRHTSAIHHAIRH